LMTLDGSMGDGKLPVSSVPFYLELRSAKILTVTREKKGLQRHSGDC
jgi:hypothetical protein